MTRVPHAPLPRLARRTAGAAVAILVTAALVAPAESSYAGSAGAGLAAVAGAGDPGRDTPRDTARRALTTAGAVLRGDHPGSGSGAHSDASLALRDLFAGRDRLGADDRRRADALLARPTDGAADPFGDGYDAPAQRVCGDHVCVHWVGTTADAPPSRSWVTTNLNILERVWAVEIDRLGYRPPVPDGSRGGDRRLDVYLKDIGANGLYGYCAPERYAPGDRDLASGYCVLDDDFARSQFNGVPSIESLKVTAAHEFFHAVQYAYDFMEDRWMMEATATWVEERFADDVNDNRQYLRAGQLGAPRVPLDRYGRGSWAYGNWLFFEYLSQRKGVPAVRRIWNKAGAFDGAPNLWSTQALRSFLRHNGPGFARFYAGFAAGNTIPSRTYAEGRAYRPTSLARLFALGPANPSTGRRGFTPPHMSSRTYGFRPSSRLAARDWRLRISLDLPQRSVGPAATVLVHRRSGRVDRIQVKLGERGNARLTVPFSYRTVKRVTVTIANGGTRFACWRNTTWSCSGTPLDDDWAYRFSGTITR